MTLSDGDIGILTGCPAQAQAVNARLDQEIDQPLKRRDIERSVRAEVGADQRARAGQAA